MTCIALRWFGAGALLLSLGCSYAQVPAPRVLLVQPSGPTVPANLLRLSLTFASPVEGPVLAKLALLRSDGSRVADPFLEQELWSADGRVLTVLLHPGRVKTGLKAREALGPILSIGDDVRLLLDGRAIKRWRAVADDDAGPTPSAWMLSTVHAGTRQPLVVALDAPIDGRDAHYIAIADERGRRVPGRARLSEGEGTWTFRPSAPWRISAYTLVARGTLEDPAGNRLGSRFETAIDAPRPAPVDASIPFRVAP
jgi:hypothetical protein